MTVGADGSDVQPLTDYPPGGDAIEIQHPVWSPDGRSVAWAEIEIGDQDASSRIVTSDRDGSGRVEFPVETGTFFLQWDPTSSRIAYLGNFQGQHRDGSGRARDRGRSDREDPRGRATVLPLVGARAVSSCSSTWEAGRSAGWISKGSSARSVTLPGIFQAPVWLADGRMVYATASEDGQALVVRDGAETRELVAFEGSIEFVVSPHGEQIAYRVDDGSDLERRRRDRRRVGSHRGRVTESPTLAFHWSPDGRPALAADGGGGRRPRGLPLARLGRGIRAADRTGVRPEPHVPGGLRPVLRPVRAVDDPLVTGRRRVRLRRVDRRSRRDLGAGSARRRAHAGAGGRFRGGVVSAPRRAARP